MRQRAIIALVDDVLIQPPIEAAALACGFDIAFSSARVDAPPADIVAQLAARRPDLLIIDLRADGWERWALAAKTNPATRRIPILAFGPHVDKARLARAREAGADTVVSMGAFRANIPALIEKHARPDDSAELLRQSALPLPEAALEGVRQFNAGEYFEQHETFEHLWRAEPGPVRALYQAILQVGVAYYQIQRGNAVGARKLFQRAWQYLDALPDVCQGVDVAQLRADARAADAALERLGPDRVAEFDPLLYRPLHLVGQPAPTSSPQTS